MQKDDYFPDPTTGMTCIRCSGVLSSRGYGQAWIKGKNVPAHRVAYENAFGPIPDGLLVMHLCNNKWCINPEHLRLGTYSDNANYAVSSGRWKHDQRFGRSATANRALPKGISWDTSRNKYLVQIRVGSQRPRVRVNTLEEAIQKRSEMEKTYWSDNA